MNRNTLHIFKLLIRSILVMGLLSGTGTAMAQVARQSFGDSAFYPRLDSWPETEYEFGLAVIPTTKLENDLGDTAQTEIDAKGMILKSEPFLQGLIDVGLVLDAVTFGDSTRIDLPGQLLHLGTDVDATWRYTGDYALQFGVRPGLFSELEAIGTDAIYIPFSGYFLKRLGPDLSGIAGLEIRPSFELGIMPTLALDWAVSDSMLLRFGLPESRLDYAITDDLGAFLHIEWENTSYKLDDDALFSRETMTLEDIAIAGGATKELGNGMDIGGELGLRVMRSIQFEVFGPEGVDDIDVDDAFFARIFGRRTF